MMQHFLDVSVGSRGYVVPHSEIDYQYEHGKERGREGPLSAGSGDMP